LARRARAARAPRAARLHLEQPVRQPLDALGGVADLFLEHGDAGESLEELGEQAHARPLRPRRRVGRGGASVLFSRPSRATMSRMSLSARRLAASSSASSSALTP